MALAGGGEKWGSFAPGMNQLLCFASFFFSCSDGQILSHYPDTHPLEIDADYISFNPAVGNIWDENKKSLNKIRTTELICAKVWLQLANMVPNANYCPWCRTSHTTSPSTCTMFTCWLRTSSSSSTWSVTWWKRDAGVQNIRIGKNGLQGSERGCCSSL